jgi:type I restriction enzyme M protein
LASVVDLWLFASKSGSTYFDGYWVERFRDRRGEVLFIDARKMGRMVDRTHRELTDEDIAKIADTYRARLAGGFRYWRVRGRRRLPQERRTRRHPQARLCANPRRYVGAEAVPDDGELFEEKMARLVAQLRELQAEAAKLDAAIAANLKQFGYGM